MTRASRELLERLRNVEDAVAQITRSIDRIEVATIVRDPSSSLGAEAYDGLRRQVVAGASERFAHLHQLARFDEAVSTGTMGDLASLVREWMAQAGLELVADPYDTSYYEVLGGEGSRLRILRPAYRDGRTGRPVLMGQVERCHDAMADEAHRQEVSS